MKRFVIVATMRRGVVNPPELLDGDGQAAAFQRMWMDRGMGNAVVWARGAGPDGVKLPERCYESRAKIERLVELARRAG